MIINLTPLEAFQISLFLEQQIKNLQINQPENFDLYEYVNLNKAIEQFRSQIHENSTDETIQDIVQEHQYIKNQFETQQ